MTISSTINRWAYNGDGSTTVFPYTNKIFAASDLVVTVGGAAQVLNTDYTVSGVGAESGGSVTFTSAPASGTGNVIVVRSVPYTQGTDIPEGGAFPSSSVEDGFDKVTVLSQQVKDSLDRSMVQPDSDTTSIGELPASASRASKFLAFDSSGDPIASTGPTGDSSIPVSAFIETLLDDANAAAALATLGAQADLDVPSQAEAEAGTATTERVWTAERVKQAIRALAVPQPFISGCVPSSAADTDHDITFSAGRCLNAAETAVLTLPALTKQFDAAFAEGTNAGGLGDSVSLPASGTFYIFAITKDSDGTVDYFGDTSSSGANVPSGWTVEREVFRVMTDASNNFRAFESMELAGGAVRVRLDGGPESTEVLGTSAATLITLEAPPGSRAIFSARASRASTSILNVLLSEISETDAAVTNDNTNLSFGTTSASLSAIIGVEMELKLDTNRQIRGRSSLATTTLNMKLKGWIDERVA